MPFLETCVRTRAATKAAAALVGEVVAALRGTTPAGSGPLAASLAGYATVLLRAGAYADAEKLSRESLAIRERVEPDTWHTAETRSLLGEALLGGKRYAAAEPLVLAGYDGMKARATAIPTAVRDRLPAAADRLAALYTATNKPDEVKKWRSERAKYPPEVVPSPRPAK